MIRIAALVVAVATLFAGPLAAQAPINPSTELSPEDVVAIQLKALSDAENDAQTNNGIDRIWVFAHPANRRLTGPLPRFRRMLLSPNYRALLGHRSYRLQETEMGPDKAQYAVRVTSSDGDVYGYAWQLGKVSSGTYKDMWMTTGVLLIGKLGQSL